MDPKSLLSVYNDSPVLASHRWSVLPALARILPSGENATEFTALECPRQAIDVFSGADLP